MKIITATVTDQNLIVSSSVLSVSETVGDYNLKITYDSEWDEADKIITFKNSNGLAIAIKDDESEDGVQIPWEILRCPGKVTVGVMGYIGTTQKLATTGIYERNTFIVLPAAFGLQEALTPTPDVYQKLMQALEEVQGEIGDLDDLNTEAKNNLVSAINEVLSQVGGTTDFNELENRPKYNGATMTGSTNIPKVPTKTSELSNNSGFITSSALSSYATTSDLTTGLATKQNTLSTAQLNTVNSGLTSTDKTKLDGIEAGAEVNDINSISVNGTPVTPDANKNVNLSVMAYTAGNGLNLTGTEFSADTTVLATQSDLANKQNTLTAGSNISITNDTISATDTTYSAFTGTDGTTAGTSGLVPAPATTDADKFLKSDGTWDEAGSSITPVQTTGTSTTDVMSQNAVTSMVYADPSALTRVRIGTSANASGDNAVAIGRQSDANNKYSVALGTSSATSAQGEFSIGGGSLGANGYNGTQYRLLTNVYDPQSAHDAATKGYVDGLVGDIESALNIINNGGNI